MQKGNFDVKHFGQNDTTIQMENWIEPVLINTGDVTLQIRGVNVLPQEQFALGGTGIVLNQIEEVYFTGSETGNKKFAVAYNTLKGKNCN